MLTYKAENTEFAFLLSAYFSAIDFCMSSDNILIRIIIRTHTKVNTKKLNFKQKILGFFILNKIIRFFLIRFGKRNKRQIREEKLISVFSIFNLDFCINSDYNIIVYSFTTNKINRNGIRFPIPKCKPITEELIDFMKQKELKKIYTSYNFLYKELEDLYREEANIAGLSKSALWILCVLSEQKEEYSQSKICEQLNLSRQTINSTVLNLEKQGIISLKAVPDNRKEKLIVLTEKGKRLVNDNVSDFVKAEKAVFVQMGVEEMEEFLRLMKKYNALYRSELKKISICRTKK